MTAPSTPSDDDTGDVVQEIVTLATSLGITPADLASVVHHTAFQEALATVGDATTASPTTSPEEAAYRAAHSLNAALDDQVAYLASRAGAIDTEHLLRTAAARSTLDDVDELDLLEDLEPANDLVAATAHGLNLRAPELSVLAHHHSPDHRESYLLLYDHAALWSPLPGAREYVGLHLIRDADTFHLAHQRMPLLPLAQAWLRARGCPALLYPAGGPAPADAATVRIEHTIGNSPDRYELVEDYTHNPGTGDTRTCAILLDHHPDAASPHRLLVEDVTIPQAFTYRVAEHAYATAREASEALEAHLARPPDPTLGRLPPPPTPQPPQDHRRAHG